jgi:hypothetical protein
MTYDIYHLRQQKCHIGNLKAYYMLSFYCVPLLCHAELRRFAILSSTVGTSDVLNKLNGNVTMYVTPRMAAKDSSLLRPVH